MNVTDLEQARHRLDAFPPRNRTAALLTRAAAAVGEHSSPLFQLVVLRHLKGFLRHIVVTTVRREFPDGDLAPREGMNAEIHHDFMALAVDLGVVREQQREPRHRLRPEYAAVVAAPDVATARIPEWQADRADYARVRRLAEEAESDTAPRHLRRNDVRYLLVLARYIRELEHMSFTHQVKPSFDSTFYSDLGELAFQLYTAGSYRKLFRRLAPASMLDVGCGEGRHLEQAARQPQAPRRMVGVELDPLVAESARGKLAGRSGVEVVATDLLSWEADPEPFDLVLSSYMLFYLPREDHVPFFRKVRDLLAPGGTYVLGQYFPDFREYQRALIQRHSPVPRFHQWAADTGNSLLFAETLLNRCLAHFRSVVYWDALRDDLAAAGLTVREVTPADPLFYSFHVLINRSDDG